MRFSILLFHAFGMKANSSDNTDSRWQKAPVAYLVRHVQSGNYYARIRVRGKLIWKTLKTDRISVAKLRLDDFHKEERQRAAAQTAVARGKMTFGDAWVNKSGSQGTDPQKLCLRIETSPGNTILLQPDTIIY